MKMKVGFQEDIERFGKLKEDDDELKVRLCSGDAKLLNVGFKEQSEEFCKLAEVDDELRMGFTGVQTRVQPDYNKLINRPSIQDVLLEGDLTLKDLGTTTIYYDTTAHWDEKINLVPEKGAIYIYSDFAEDPYNEGVYTPGIKIGDGTTYLVDLPYFATQSSYIALSYKPSINGVILQGALTLEDLGIEAAQYNTEEYWNQRSDLIAQKGTIYIYSDHEYDGNTDTWLPGIKVGDGTSYLIDLPFIDDKLKNLFYEHDSNTERHITALERANWNNKVSAFIDPNRPEVLVLSTEDQITEEDLANMSNGNSNTEPSDDDYDYDDNYWDWYYDEP